MNDAPSSPPPGAPPPPPLEQPTPHRGHSQRLAIVAGIAALTFGLSGFFMGLRHTADVSLRQRTAWRAAPPPPVSPPTAADQPTAGARPTPGPARERATTADAAIPEAVPYARLAEHTLQPNRGWNSRLADLPHPTAALRPVMPTAEQEELLRRQRASRRQYDGAPPVAPHPINQVTPAACLECHGRPTFISGIAVPQMSHQLYQNCLQCHAPAGGPTSTWRGRELSPAEGNTFLGRPPAGHGRRAYLGAPPVVPHSTWMRQNCLSCHGPTGTAAFRTSHPERQNCLQCHATDSAAEQRPPLFVGAETGLGPEAGGGAGSIAPGGDNSRPPPLPSRTPSRR